MTTVYFVRHAEPNYANHNDVQRELTDKGLLDRELVTQYLADKEIDVVLSSPYKRAVDTVRDFADKNRLTIQTVEDFRERKVDSVWIENFNEFNQIKFLMPWIVKFVFEDRTCIEIEKINLFEK